MARHCLVRKLDSISIIEQELAAWEQMRDKEYGKVTWHFTPLHSRTKLLSLYPKFEESGKGGADIFLDWLSNQTKAHPVLQRAHVSKGYFYPLFVIPCQIFIQYVNEFLDAYSCPVPVVKHLVFQTAKQPFAGGIVRGASLF